MYNLDYHLLSARSSDTPALYQRSRSPSAQPRRPSSSRSWAEVVCHSSLCAAAPSRPSPRCCEEFNVNASLDSLFQSQIALMRMELLQLAEARVEEASRPLREEVATLKLLLARVGDSLESSKACTSSGRRLRIRLTLLSKSHLLLRKNISTVVSLLMVVPAPHRILVPWLPLWARAWMRSCLRCCRAH
jgi:hypothetical protein